MLWKNGCGDRKGMQRSWRAFPAHHERHEGKHEPSRSVLHSSVTLNRHAGTSNRCAEYFDFLKNMLVRLTTCLPECHRNECW